MDKTYTVQAGDSLSKIAANNGVNINSITGFKSGDPNKIGVGEVLTIKGVPTTPPANTISAPNLGQSSVMVPPPVTTPTAPTGLLGLAKATQDSIASLTPVVEQGEKDIKSTIETLGGQNAKRATLYDTAGVNTAKQEVDDISNQMTALDKSYNDQVDKINNNNPTGQLSAGQQIQLNQLAKDHSYTMSNLALVANTKLGKYQNAKAIVDQQVDAETADLKTKLDGLQFFYEKNFSKLSNAQKTLLEQQTDAVKTELQDKTNLLKSLGEVQLEAAKNGAPASVVAQIGRAKSLSEAITVGSQYMGNKLDDMYKTLQIKKLQQDITQGAAGGGSGIDAANLIAYAQQYASTGQIPTGIPKGSFGVISEAAKQLPKPTGTVVDVNTGVKSGKLNETQMSGITALYDINQKMKDLKAFDEQRSKGLVAGTLGKIFGSDAQQKYIDTRQEIIDLLARARTGAALTASEETFYKSQLPGRLSDPVFGLFGANSDTKIANFDKKIQESLNSKLSNNGLAIYGFSTVNLGGTPYKVGDVISNSTQTARVNADGSLSLLTE